jgi:hypothetical protein
MSENSGLQLLNTQKQLKLQLARVVGYDPNGSIVRVWSATEQQPLDTQPISSLLNIGRDGDLITGAGINVAPEDGCLALIIQSSSGEWYTLGYISPYDGAPNKYKILREKRRQGDIALSTRDGNSVKVLAGGEVNTRASALTGTSWVPNGERVLTTAKNYVIQTLAGSLDWTVNEKNNKSSAVLSVKSSIDEDAPRGILALGHNQSGHLFEATTSTSPKSRFSINKQGVVRVDSAKDINIRSGDKEGVIRVNSRMIYLNSAASAAPPPSTFPDNAIQVDPVSPSQPTPDASLDQFAGVTTSFSAPDTKRELSESTFSQQSAPLPRA